MTRLGVSLCDFAPGGKNFRIRVLPLPDHFPQAMQILNLSTAFMGCLAATFVIRSRCDGEKISSQNRP
jgi:hypothetical protein